MTIHPIVLTILCSMILSLIGYIVGNVRSGKTEAALTENVAKLNESITRLDTTLSGKEKINEMFEKGCIERHKVIDNRLMKLEN